MNTDKAISGLSRWSEPDGADKKISLSAPLEIGESTLQGFLLKGRAHLDSRDRNISFSIVYQAPGSKRDAVSLARLDWRPKTPHSNQDTSSPPELYLLDIPGTHHHSFALNWRASINGPLKWLPVAEPIIPDYQGFGDLLDGVGKLFRISNITSIPEPDWTQDLFR